MTQLTSFDLETLRTIWNRFGDTDDFLRVLEQKDPTTPDRKRIRRVVLVASPVRNPLRETVLGHLHFISQGIVFFNPGQAMGEFRKFFGVFRKDLDQSPILYRLESFAPETKFVSMLFESSVSTQFPCRVRFQAGPGHGSCNEQFRICRHYWVRIHQFLNCYLRAC